MKDKIYDAIKLQSGKINFKTLRKKFMLDQFALQNLLLELKLEGKILQVGNKYSLFPDDMFIGDVSTTRNGNKMVFYNGTKIPIADEFVDMVLLNDAVSFRVNSNNEAEITSIVDRRITNVTCEVVVVNGKKKLVPYRDGMNILLSSEDLEQLLDGDIILVSIDGEMFDDYLKGKLVKFIRHKFEPNKPLTTIAMNYGFDNDYSDEYMEELNNLPKYVSEEEMVGREDLRDLSIVTIDCDSTHDMDDSVYGEYVDGDDVLVYVNITAIASYIKSNSLMFERALDKTTSLYLLYAVFHMFHHIFSNGIGSLNEHEDRLAITVKMRIDKDGNIIDSDIFKSVINSKKKMSYSNVDKIILGEEIVSGYEDFVDMLNTLNDAAERLYKKFMADGMLDFGSNEIEFVYDRDGNPVSFGTRKSGPAARMIEMLMIAANITVAKFFHNLGIPIPYRTHDVPDVKLINSAFDKVNDIIGERKDNGNLRKGEHIIKHISDVYNHEEFQLILKKLSFYEDYPFLCSLLLQNLKRAEYSIDNIGHYGLGQDFYTHFTSPIRRLCDLIVHMILEVVLDNPEKLYEMDFSKLEESLREISKRATYMQKQADDAERDADRLGVMMCMQHEIDSEYECTVVEIRNNKVKIKINNIFAYVDFQSLASNFVYDPDRHYFYDSLSNLYLKNSCRVIVKLLGINLTDMSLKLSILGVVNQKTLTKEL